MKSEEEIRAILEGLRRRLNKNDDLISSYGYSPKSSTIINLKLKGVKIEGQIHALIWVLQNAMA